MRTAGRKGYKVKHSIPFRVLHRVVVGGVAMHEVDKAADYLPQFLDPRVVTENTVRRGFSPDVFS